MFVLCHGKASGIENELTKRTELSGSGGLKLGREMVLRSNVGLWTAIRGRVGEIVVYSCRAAAASCADAQTDRDGKLLMSAFAMNTGAIVYASDDIQWYSRYRGLAHGRMDIGEWRGRLWKFSPTGGCTIAVTSARTEFADVMAASS